MKMLNCPECGLTIPDSQEACPKCHSKVESMTLEIEKEVKVDELQKEIISTDSSKSEKVEMIAPVTLDEEKVDTSDPARIKEEMIAAVVEAEALAAIEEEQAAEEHSCKTCMAALPQTEAQTPIVPKTDDEVNKWMAAIGYIAFFVPVLLGYHRRSKFAKYHAKQAVTLFIASTILFLGLVILKNRINELFTTSSITNFNDGSSLGLVTADISWHHGTGVLFHYYLTGMIYALHLVPFALMLTGIINSIQGKKKPLPLIGRLVKLEEAKNIE